jgi:hypothetical protein
MAIRTTASQNLFHFSAEAVLSFITGAVRGNE